MIIYYQKQKIMFNITNNCYQYNVICMITNNVLTHSFRINKKMPLYCNIKQNTGDLL